MSNPRPRTIRGLGEENARAGVKKNHDQSQRGSRSSLTWQRVQKRGGGTEAKVLCLESDGRKTCCGLAEAWGERVRRTFFQ